MTVSEVATRRVSARERGYPWVLFAFALAVRLVAVFYLHSYDLPMHLSEHDGIAAHLVLGDGFAYRPVHGISYLQLTSWMAPLYPFFLAGVYLLLGMNTPAAYLSIELLQALSSAFGCLFVYWIGRKLWSHRVGEVAGFIMALYPPLIYSVTRIRPITFIVDLLALEVLLVLQLSEKPRTGIAVAAGIVIGLLALLEPVMLIFAPFACLWLYLHAGENGGRFLRLICVMAIVALLVVLPWTVRNFIVHGRFVFIESSLGYQLWVGNNPHATGTSRLLPAPEERGLCWPEQGIFGWRDVQQLLWRQKETTPTVFSTMPLDLREQLRSMSEVEGDALLLGLATDWIREHPARFLVLSLQRLKYYWWLDPSNPLATMVVYALPWFVLFPLALLGIVLSRRSWRRLSLLCFLLISVTVPYLVTVVEPRYRMPLEPYIILFAAYAVCRVATLKKTSEVSGR